MRGDWTPGIAGNFTSEAFDDRRPFRLELRMLARRRQRAAGHPLRHRHEERAHRPPVLHRVLGLLLRGALARRELAGRVLRARRTDRRARCRAAAGSRGRPSVEWTSAGGRGRRPSTRPSCSCRRPSAHGRARGPSRAGRRSSPMTGSRSAASANGNIVAEYMPRLFGVAPASLMLRRAPPAMCAMTPSNTWRPRSSVLNP